MVAHLLLAICHRSSRRIPNRVSALGRRMERFADAHGAEETEAFEVVPPVEIVCAVAVVIELHGVILPEPQVGVPGALPHELEPERVVLPQDVTGDAAPGGLSALVNADIFTLAFQHFAQAVGASKQKQIVLVLEQHAMHLPKHILGRSCFCCLRGMSGMRMNM